MSRAGRGRIRAGATLCRQQRVRTADRQQLLTPSAGVDAGRRAVLLASSRREMLHSGRQSDVAGDEIVPAAWIGDRTLAEIAEAEFAVEPTVPEGERFRESGWKLDGVVENRCPNCGFEVWMCRRPYISQGRPYRYYAFICPPCRTVWTRQDVAWTTRPEERTRARPPAGAARAPAPSAVADGGDAETGDAPVGDPADLLDALSRLAYRQRRVLELRREGRTLAEIGKSFSVTRERIRQIQNQAVAQLSKQTGLTFDECVRLLDLEPTATAVAPPNRVLPGSVRRGKPLDPSELAEFDQVVRGAVRDGLLAGRHLTALVLAGSVAERVVRAGYDKLPVHGRCAHIVRAEMVDRIDQLIESGELRLSTGPYPVLRVPSNNVP